MAGNYSGVVTLLHCDGTNRDPFRDSSLSNHRATSYGDTYIDTSGTDQYGGTNGAALLDGAGDALSVPDSDDWNLAAGDWGMECWFKRASADSNRHALISRFYGAENGRSFLVRIDNDGLLDAIAYNGASALGEVRDVGDVDDTDWHHVLFTRWGGNVYLYLDGAHLGTDTISGSVYDSNEYVTFGGRDREWTNPFSGNMGEIRLVGGTSPIADSADPLYIASGTPADGFTPPTSAYTSGTDGGIDANCILAMHLNEPGPTIITDSSYSGSHTLGALGDAQIATDQYVFGTASLLLGDNNFGTAPSDSDFRFAGDDFGIDFRSRFTSVASSIGLFDNRASAITRAGMSWDQANGWLSFVAISGGTSFDVQADWSPSVDTWYHIAVMRSGDFFHIYVDGTDLTSSGGTDSSNYPNIIAPFEFGRYTGASVTWYLPGWIDEFRIVNGVAPVNVTNDPLYIATHSLSDGFTPPVEAYSAQFWREWGMGAKRDYTVGHVSQLDAERDQERPFHVAQMQAKRDTTAFSIAQLNSCYYLSGGYKELSATALRNNIVMREAEADAKRENLKMRDSRICAHSENYTKLGYYVWSRDMSDDSLTNHGYIDQGGTELTGVTLADGTYHIELRPSGYFWPEARDAEIYAAKIVDGSLAWWLPPVEDLTANRQSGKTRLRWRWPGYSGAQTPDSFGLWFGTAAGVDTSGTSTGTVEYEAAGVYQYTRTHATAEVAAVASVLNGTVGDVTEIALSIPSSALPPVIPQWVEEST